MKLNEYLEQLTKVLQARWYQATCSAVQLARDHSEEGCLCVCVFVSECVCL